MKKGSLTIVGTGIRSVAQTTLEARATMEQADKLFYVMADPVTETWLRRLNPTAEALHDCYAEGKKRIDTYNDMVERILDSVRAGLEVCMALYGHPGVFVYPSHKAIQRAREEGYAANMLPGVSAEDCLFADLGFDPAKRGCQSYEATDFLVRHRNIEPTSDLILWQVGIIGEDTFKTSDFYKPEGLRMLVEALGAYYPADHEVVVYLGSQYPVTEPLMHRVPLGELTSVDIPGMATLYVPPLPPRPVDMEVIKRLGLQSC